MAVLKVRTRVLTCAMMLLRDLVARIVYLRLAKTPKRPVSLRLCAALKLSRCEIRAFLFLLVCHGGVDFRTFTDVRPTASSMAKFAGMNSHEFAAFLGDERIHFKQGLLGSTDSRLKRVSTQSVLKMPEEVVASLYLVKLTETAFLKLDKTCLSELIQEEGLVETSCLDLSMGVDEEVDDNIDEEEEEDDEKGGKRKRGTVPDENKVRKTVENTTATTTTAADEGQDVPSEKPESLSSVSPAPIAHECLPLWKPSIDQELLVPSTGAISLDVGAYTHDLQYLDDVFKLLSTQIRLRTTESDMKDDDPEMLVTPKSKQEAQMRELKGRERMLKLRVEKRMAKTKAAGLTLPRMEQLQRKRGFSNFEKMVLLLLVGNIMSHDVLIAANGKYVMRGDAQRECTVGYLLYVLCDSLEERVVRRKVFYKDAALLKDGLLTVNSKSYGACDLMECTVDIDRRMVDSLMGLDTEFSEIVEGSHLYTSKVPLDNVILPKEHKELILSTIKNYDAFQRCKKRVGLEDIVSYGNGLVLLFYGPSGTGKTMLANAIAHDMGKKVLLVSLQQVKSSGRSPELLRFVFREAKLADAVVFFDECDSFFETRESNPVIPSLLQELEKYSGMMILATNKAHALDEAMNRRITLAIEFHAPDHQMRCEIWKRHIPATLHVADNVDFSMLATDYELSGGLIKNALLTSISHAVARENGNEDPVLKMEDFVQGAKTQLRSFFNKDLNQPNQIIPKRSLDDCIYPEQIKKKILEVIQVYKGKKHIQSMWGYAEAEVGEMNSTILMYGPSGVGKSLAAEAIGYECGHVIRVINTRALRLGRTGLDEIFEQVNNAGAILVLDEAQELFNFSNESKQMIELLHYHSKKCVRPVLVIARTQEGETLDPITSGLSAYRTIKFSIQPPDLRELHWKKSFTDSTPLHANIDFKEISQKVLSPGAIRNAAYFAACKASMLPPPNRFITQSIVKEAIDELVEISQKSHQDIYC
eukprot:TRINITY_DN5641_c1_g1_i1.p1 TRINITY_DN5641_c1_g1~~TRINITY_DN5641_c1_g1_i1.p1  ORF type:complete len:1094 (+),score=379.18 TRINITY_DN5641_c1_g1_i1:332-3283(+)